MYAERCKIGSSARRTEGAEMGSGGEAVMADIAEAVVALFFFFPSSPSPAKGIYPICDINPATG